MAINSWWDSDPSETYWMEITDRDDIGGELWAPKHDVNGHEQWSYNLVSFVQPGDRVFHWRKADRAIIGWSEAAGPLTSDTRSWLARGTAGRARGVPTVGPAWIMPLKGLQILEKPITRPDLNGPLYDDVVALLHSVEEVVGEPAYAPFQHYGSSEIRAQQGYLTKMPAALVALLFPDSAPVAPSTPGAAAQSPKRSRGQAYMADAVKRSAVERRAVEVAKAHYLAAGADEIVELGKPYDLWVMLNGVERHIEVKGSTVPDIETIQLTQGEVDHAHAWAETDLIIVDGIRLWEENGVVRADGGTLHEWQGWKPLARHLRPTHLRYRLQAAKSSSG